MKVSVKVASLVTAIAACFAGSAFAQVDVGHTNVTNATAHCQPATAVADGGIRKRPLAVQNEGTSTVGVTCSFELDVSDGIFALGPLDIWLYNGDTTAKTVTCTGVSGYQTGTNEYVAKSVTIDPGEQGSVSWTLSDFPGGSWASSLLISANCQLPPKVGINDSYLNWGEVDETEPAA